MFVALFIVLLNLPLLYPSVSPHSVSLLLRFCHLLSWFFDLRIVALRVEHAVEFVHAVQVVRVLLAKFVAVVSEFCEAIRNLLLLLLLAMHDVHLLRRASGLETLRLLDV